MARCGFCQKSFPSKQSVRAHLRYCEAYKNPGPQGQRPKGRAAFLGRNLPKAEKDTGFDPAFHARQEVEAEESRLRLRQIRGAHEELDAKEAERARRTKEEAEAARQREQEQVKARRQAELELQERKRKEQAERERQRRRREIIQKIKDRVIRQWWAFSYTIPAETQARALKEVEQELAALPVEELPEKELIAIAEGVREKLYRPVMEAQDETKRQQAERAQEESEKPLRALIEQLQRNENKQAVIDYGYNFANEELNELGAGPWLERWRILEQVRLELDRRFDGTVSKDELEDKIENVVGAILRKHVN